MASATYHGTFRNAAEDFLVEGNEDDGYYIAVQQYCECGHECCSRPKTGTRPHTNELKFEDGEEAYDYLEALRERSEEDYDNYLEENRYEIAQMERYEMWRNEY